MKKLAIMLFAFVMMFSVLPTNEGQAKVKNGTYKANYTMIKPDSKSASYADGYFTKPAKIVVKNGKMTATITMKKSSWIKSFVASTGGNKIVSKNKKKNTRTVKFNVKSVSSKKPTKVKMRIEIPSQNYYHTYTVRMKFGALKKVK